MKFFYANIVALLSLYHASGEAMWKGNSFASRH